MKTNVTAIRVPTSVLVHSLLYDTGQALEQTCLLLRLNLREHGAAWERSMVESLSELIHQTLKKFVWHTGDGASYSRVSEALSRFQRCRDSWAAAAYAMDIFEERSPDVDTLVDEICRCENARQRERLFRALSKAVLDEHRVLLTTRVDQARERFSHRVAELLSADDAVLPLEPETRRAILLHGLLSAADMPHPLAHLTAVDGELGLTAGVGSDGAVQTWFSQV